MSYSNKGQGIYTDEIKRIKEKQMRYIEKAQKGIHLLDNQTINKINQISRNLQNSLLYFETDYQFGAEEMIKYYDLLKLANNLFEVIDTALKEKRGDSTYDSGDSTYDSGR